MEFARRTVPLWSVDRQGDAWVVRRSDGVECNIHITSPVGTDERAEAHARDVAAALNRIYGSTEARSQ